MLKEKQEENKIDFTGVPLKLLEKMRNTSTTKLNPGLIQISKRQIFDIYPDKFDLVLTQTNPESQQIMCNVVDGNLITNRHCIDYLLYFTDCPDKQRKVLKFAAYPGILYEEMFMISMVGIEDEYVEDKLIDCFKRNLISNTHDYLYYKNMYERLSIKGNIKKILKTAN